MRTPDALAAADQQMEATQPEELDRRTMRCRCTHSLDAHQVPSLAPYDTSTLAIPAEYFTHPPCTRCDCGRFHSRLTPWRVELAPIEGGLIPLDRHVVRTPRGSVFCRVGDRVTAFNLAQSMAAVDQLLARVNRLERTNYGTHPAVRYPIPRGYPVPTGPRLVVAPPMGDGQ